MPLIFYILVATVSVLIILLIVIIILRNRLSNIVSIEGSIYVFGAYSYSYPYVGNGKFFLDEYLHNRLGQGFYKMIAVLYKLEPLRVSYPYIKLKKSEEGNPTYTYVAFGGGRMVTDARYLKGLFGFIPEEIYLVRWWGYFGRYENLYLYCITALHAMANLLKEQDKLINEICNKAIKKMILEKLR